MEGTYEIYDKTAVAEASGWVVEEGLAVRRTGLAEGGRETAGVRVGVSKVEYGRKVTVT